MSHTFTASFAVKANQAGIVYGRQGSFKARVESECGVVITKNRGGDARNPSFTITGNPGACDRARTMILRHISTVIARPNPAWDPESSGHQVAAAPVVAKPKAKTTERVIGNRFADLADVESDGVGEVTTCLSKLAVGGKKGSNASKANKMTEKPPMTLDEYLAGQGKVVVAEDVTTKEPNAKRLRQIAKRGTTFSLHPKGRIGKLKFENWKAHMARLEAQNVDTEPEAAVAIEIAGSPPHKRSYDEAFNDENDNEVSDEETIAARPTLRARRSRSPETTKVEANFSWGDMAEDHEDDERPSSTLNPTAHTFVPKL